jgi:hypothetical protein
MSLKAELETWAAALKAYDEEDFEKALDLFSVRCDVLCSVPAVHLATVSRPTSALRTHQRY